MTKKINIIYSKECYIEQLIKLQKQQYKIQKKKEEIIKKINDFPTKLK